MEIQIGQLALPLRFQMVRIAMSLAGVALLDRAQEASKSCFCLCILSDLPY